MTCIASRAFISCRSARDTHHHRYDATPGPGRLDRVVQLADSSITRSSRGAPASAIASGTGAWRGVTAALER